jgi:hypothetical protein
MFVSRLFRGFFGSLLASFREVKLLLQQIRHEAEDCDEAAQSRADNVEIRNRKRRHLRTWSCAACFELGLAAKLVANTLK